ncbi:MULTISPECIES: restriction endonuclease [Cysteiniphilum]|uniref:restriction endonuclease n=1 Tax=Cysteiniphilum TaxID=2056696 RepID=UPI000E349343|nr:restriction endonuclease [Cysteiniphilum sp. SYW-8]
MRAKSYHNHINPAHVKDFARVMIGGRYANGLFIHTGKTGNKSYQEMGLSNTVITLISGYKLHTLITQCMS